MDPGHLYSHIGGIVKQRREQLKLTQQKLASRLQISRASLANIETGRQNLAVHQLYALADALHLTLQVLLPPVPEFDVTREEVQIRMPDDLRDKQKEQIALLIQQARTKQPG